MRSLRSHRLAVPLALTAICLAVAFAQDPGVVVADTKVNLYVDPVRFLSAVISAWTPTTTLGHVFSGQYEGYLFPMAPFYALGHDLAIPTWIVQRLWLAALLALGAWGLVALMDVLVCPRRGLAHLVAGAMFTLNPYVITDMDRTSIALLSYALLPWMLVAVHRGLREPRGWRWPAVLALLVAGSGGGVNAGVLAWVLLAPVMLVIYERVFGDIGPGTLAPYLTRTLSLGVLASLWWLVGLAVNGAHGPNVLQFTEQPGAIWNPTSLTESLRLMGYWPSYFGLSYTGALKPFYSDAGPLLFSAPVVAATLLIPGLALGALPWTLRRRYAPFALALVLVGLLVMSAGFPNGTLLRHGLSFSYYHVTIVQALRTTYKAGPLVAVGLACLGGMGAAALAEGLAHRRAATPRPGWRAASWGAAALGAALLIANAWPLAQGRGLDAALALPHGVPAAWRDVGGDLDRTLPAEDRAMVLPGQLFGFYSWGGTVDPILPQLTSRPVTERGITPYADLRADDLQWGVDALVSQQRAVPGQLAPLLNLMGVGAVVSASDGDLSRSGEESPADAARVLAGQGMATPSRSFGPRRAIAPGPGELAGPLTLPEVREYRLATGGMLRVLPRAQPTILDGDGGGIIDLAAFGDLHPDRALRYAADLTPTQIRAAARTGANLVITDSDRRQIFVTSSLFENAGPVLGPDDPISPDSAVLNPFAAQGTAAQTVAQVGGGIRDVRALVSPGFAQFPEHGPFAAIDGNPHTEWLADRHLQPFQRYLQVGFPHPRSVPYIDLTPFDNPRAEVHEVTVNGHRFGVHPGVNHLVTGLAHVSELTVALTRVTHPPVAAGGGGGITELAIPGTHPTQTLRPPVLIERALAGADLRRDSLTYLFSRVTGDRPFARQPVEPDPEIGQIDYPGDAETVLARSFTPPAARAWTVRAWVSSAATADDAALDRLVGYRDRATFSSSSRFAGRPGFRASSAFAAGAPSTGWIGEYTPDEGDWIQVSSPHLLTATRLALVASSADVRAPTEVRVSWPGGDTGPLAVSGSGAVALGQTVRAHRLRITVLASRHGRAGVRAVGIGRVRGIAGLGAVVIPRSGSLPGRCDGPSLTVAGHRVRLAVHGTIAAFDAGRPLPARACGVPVSLAAGPTTLRGIPGPLSIDLLSLRSAAPDPAPVTGQTAAAGPGGGAVLAPGRVGNGSVTGARVSADGPSWLVLGQS
jgi:arabinofuranan 3-O-arabinosyltransferase